MSRVTEIRYVGYGVKEFDAEKTYYSEVWGLEPVGEDQDHAWFKAQGHDEHHVVQLRRANENRVDVIALAADTRADVEALRGKVADAGCQIVSEPGYATSSSAPFPHTPQDDVV